MIKIHFLPSPSTLVAGERVIEVYSGATRIGTISPSKQGFTFHSSQLQDGSQIKINLAKPANFTFTLPAQT